MAELTGAGSTSKSSLSASTKSGLLNRKNTLQRIVDKIKSGGKKLHEIATSDEIKAVKFAVSNPKEIIKEGIIGKKGINLLGEKLQEKGKSIKSGENIFDRDIKHKPLIGDKLIGAAVEQLGQFWSTPHQTAESNKEIIRKVNNNELNPVLGNIQLVLGTGLATAQTIWKPMAVVSNAIGFGLKGAGIDEDVDKLTQGGKDTISSQIQENTGVSKNNADSAVDSVFNTAMLFAGIKGGKYFGKGENLKTQIMNTGKSAVIESVPELVTIAYGVVVDKYGKDPKEVVDNIKKSSGVKESVAVLATGLVPGISQTKGKLPKTKGTDLGKVFDVPKKQKITPSETKKITKPKVDLKKLFDEPIQIKEIPDVKKSLAAEQKLIKSTVSKKTSNNLKILSGLQDVKTMETNVRDGIMTKAQSLAEKTRVVNLLIKDGIMQKGLVDQKGQSYTFTDKAKTVYNIGGKKSSLPFLREGVHLPVKTTVVPKKITPKKPKVDLKSLVDDTKITPEEVKILEAEAKVSTRESAIGEYGADLSRAYNNIINRKNKSKITVGDSKFDQIEQLASKDKGFKKFTDAATEYITSLGQDISIQDLFQKMDDSFKGEPVSLKKPKVDLKKSLTETKIPIEELPTNKIVQELDTGKGVDLKKVSVEPKKFRFTEGLKVNLNIIKKVLTKIKGEKAQSIIVDNLKGLFDNIVLTDKNGRRVSASSLINGIIGDAKTTRRGILETLGFDTLRKFEDNSTKEINTGYDYVKKNYKTLIPGDDIASVMRRKAIELPDDALYARTATEKGVNSSKNRVLFEFVGGEIRARMEADKIAQRKAIYDSKMTDAQKKAAISEVELSNDKILQIQEDVIKTMPEEIQPYLRESYEAFGQFSKDTLLKEAFKEIGEDIKDEGFIKYLQEDYTHGYISNEKLKAYAKATNQDFDTVLKRFEDVNIEGLRDSGIATPEQMASILKKTRDVWYLHSQNPLDIMNSYATQLSKLKEQKNILAFLDEVKSKDKATGDYLTEKLSGDKNFVMKKILGIGDDSKIQRSVNNLSKVTAFTKYVGNTAMMVQNLTFATTVGAFKALTNKFTGRAKYENSWKDLGETRKYLFDEGLMAHKMFDIDSTKGNVPLSRKVGLQLKDKLVSSPLRYFTATFVPQIQSFVASGYMNKIVQEVGGGIKDGENLAKAFERTVAGLPEQDRILVKGELANQVSAVENNSRLSSATSSVFDIPLFNMVKGFNRQNFSTIFKNISDTIDTLDQARKKDTTGRKTNKATREISDKLLGTDTTGAIDNLSSLTSRTIAMYAGLKVLSEMLFDTEDEKEKFVEYTFAENLPEYFENLATTPLGVPGLDMVSGNINEFTKGVTGIFNADTKEGKWDEFKKMFFKINTGLGKFRDAIYNAQGDFQRHESRKGGYSYTDTPSTSILGTFMGINPSSAAYNNLFNQINDIKKEMPSTMAEKFDNWINSARVISNFTRLKSDVELKKFRTDVDNMNDRINSKIDEKMTFDEFINNAMGVEETERSKSFVENLQKKYKKDIPANKKVVSKLLKIVREINGVKRTDIIKGDFNATLDVLKKNNPKLYSKFYAELYNTLSGDVLDPEVRENNNLFISNVINRDMDGELLSTVVSDQIGKLQEKILKNEFRKDIPDEYDKLRILNETIGLLDGSPDLRNQIEDSLSQLINEDINDENILQIREAIKDFPQLFDLYKRAAELRGATFREEKVEEPEKNDKIDLKRTITNNGNIKGIPIISLETERKNGNLIDLIDLEVDETAQPILEKPPVETLLDKVV